MKISVRPLKGASFEVETAPEQKIEDLKKSIAAAKAEFPAELQKLIYSGKILADGTCVSEYGIKPSDFVVVMVAKAKPAAAAPAAAAPAAAAPAEATAQASTSATGPGAGAGTPASPAPAATPAAATPAAATPAAAAPAAGANEGTIAQLCEMGFPREQVIECLRAAFNNPDRAVEYLMSGIPERARSRSPRGHGHGDPGGHGQSHGHSQGHEGHDAPGHDCSAHSHGGNDGHTAHGGHDGGHGHEGHDAPGHDCSSHGHNDQGHGHGHGQGHTAPAGAGGGGGLAFPALSGTGQGGTAAGALETLRRHPQFGELSAMVLQNPAVLPQMLAAIQQTNPELAEAITANQDEFLQMLGADEGDDDDDDDGDGHGHSHGDEGQDGAVTIEVSEADRAAVERLAALGFPPDLALEAYLACDRKEELAANYLFENQEN